MSGAPYPGPPLNDAGHNCPDLSRPLGAFDRRRDQGGSPASNQHDVSGFRRSIGGYAVGQERDGCIVGYE
jgi:hypothetical protein